MEKEIPEIREINTQLSKTIVDISKLVIAKKSNIKECIAEIKEKNLQAQNLIDSLLIAHGYPADYLQTKYFCEKCEDRGYVGSGRCSCLLNLLKKYSIEKLNEQANLPECDFNHFSLEYYRNKKDADGDDCYEIMTRIYDFCKEYADNFSLTSESLLMYGKTGVGKTHLSLSIAKTAAEKGFNAAYGSIVNLLSIIEREHFGKVSEEENMDTINLLINADLLVLDDLGSEFSSQFYESVTYNIINSRINLGLPTIISTNLSAAELQKKYNERIISRIFGEFSTLCLVGEDIRQIKRISGKM
ncbi:MAG: ATP-binding protein [Oscillospiraceae bacterium]